MDHKKVDPILGVEQNLVRQSRCEGVHANSVLAVSPNEAARLCSIGRTTLYAALSSGELKSIKLGKRRLILIESLREWLRKNQVQTGEQVQTSE